MLIDISNIKITLALFLAEHLISFRLHTFHYLYMQFSKIFLNLDASNEWLNRPCRLSELNKPAFVRMKM